MWESISSTSRYFWNYYVEALLYQWHHMTPIKYGIILIIIGVIGALMMRSSTKRC